jgi:predicted ATP-grasp superfamily ATP-dependent carboligase
MGKVLVLDAQLRSSLAVIRSLGSKGIEVTAGSECRSALGLYSKYCSLRKIYPSPRTEPDAFIHWLRRLVQQESFDCIIPSQTDTVHLLLKHRESLESFTRIPPPDVKVFSVVYDKQRFFKAAAKHRCPIPTTYEPAPIEELLEEIHQYPVIVKPALYHSFGIAQCRSSDELVNAYAKLTRLYGPCVVQEYIPNGGEYGVYTLFDEQSLPLALSVQKRVRTLHGYGGLSTLRKTVRYEELVHIAFRLLKSLRWSGVAMVEFRIDKNTGQPRVLEVNPRLWGSLQLAIEAGVDFPYLLYAFTMGEPCPSVLDYKMNIDCRWMLGDVIGFLRCSEKRHHVESFLDPTIPSDIFSLHDLKPVLFSIFTLSNMFEKEQRHGILKTMA